MPLKIVLISTYELGRQPFGLASPAAWLRAAGAEVTCFDLAVQALAPAPVAAADLIAFYVPMHTATRLALRVLPRVRQLNSRAHLCFYGLYAPVNETLLRQNGVGTVLGGEFETGLAALARRLAGPANGARSEPQPEPVIALLRQPFLTPDRRGLPPLEWYARLVAEDGTRVVGYAEASRGCKHLCRHCPIVPVYGGRFFVVPREVVIADIAQQVAAGARHITFGDPDFFNGPRHALAIAEELHRLWPSLTFDVTIKVEHLLQHARELPRLRESGCVLITTAVEAVDDRILQILAKDHTRADFVQVTHLLRETGLALNPTFVAFTPWTSRAGYLDWLDTLAALDLVENVAPVQYAIRLLVPSGSRLLELPAVRELVDEFDPAQLLYPWQHPDPEMDRLYAEVLALVQQRQQQECSRRAIFESVREMMGEAMPVAAGQLPHIAYPSETQRGARFTPRLTEPWYC